MVDGARESDTINRDVAGQKSMLYGSFSPVVPIFEFFPPILKGVEDCDFAARWGLGESISWCSYVLVLVCVAAVEEDVDSGAFCILMEIKVSCESQCHPEWQ